MPLFLLPHLKTSSYIIPPATNFLLFIFKKQTHSSIINCFLLSEEHKKSLEEKIGSYYNHYFVAQFLPITSPGWMHETSARTWCTGKTQRDRVEREVGGGIGMGNTCKSMADSCQCMTKTTTI